MSFHLLLCAFACLAGVTTVLFGFGGGFVVVPLLYRALLARHGEASAIGQSAMQVAVATSTCVMVFGSVLATRAHQRAGRIDWAQVRPLLAPIACGAAAGAALASAAEGAWLRWAFVAYLGATILDALLRPGFLSQPAPAGHRPGRRATTAAGLGIGVVAALLGVGGSVMTVPLMRRRGAGMQAAAAMANPLTLPVALAGAATYALLAWRMPALGAGFVGLVDLPALAALIGGSWLGIRLSRPWAGRLPDGLHAKVYLLLLATVLVAMALG